MPILKKATAIMKRSSLLKRLSKSTPIFCEKNLRTQCYKTFSWNIGDSSDKILEFFESSANFVLNCNKNVLLDWPSDQALWTLLALNTNVSIGSPYLDRSYVSSGPGVNLIKLFCGKLTISFFLAIALQSCKYEVFFRYFKMV